jgi:hypothetical protein
VVTFDYDALDPVELTIREGQVIENVSTDESGWWKGTLNGQTGLFPHNFVVAIDASAAQEALAVQKSATNNNGNNINSGGNASAREEAAPPRPPRKNTAAGQGVNVLAAVGGMSELQAKLEAKKKDYQKRDEPPLTLGAAASPIRPEPPQVRTTTTTTMPTIRCSIPLVVLRRRRIFVVRRRLVDRRRRRQAGRRVAASRRLSVVRLVAERRAASGRADPTAASRRRCAIVRPNHGKEELNRRETEAAVERQRRVDELSTKPSSANEQAVARAANEQRAAAQRDAAAQAEAERVEAERRAAALERDAKKAQAAKEASGHTNKRRKATEQQRSDKTRLGPRQRHVGDRLAPSGDGAVRLRARGEERVGVSCRRPHSGQYQGRVGLVAGRDDGWRCRLVSRRLCQRCREWQASDKAGGGVRAQRDDGCTRVDSAVARGRESARRRCDRERRSATAHRGCHTAPLGRNWCATCCRSASGC